MRLNRKLVIIILASVALVTIPAAIGLYHFFKYKLVIKESLALQTETDATVAAKFVHLIEAEKNLDELAALFEESLSAAPVLTESAAFDQMMQQSGDGAWRSKPIAGQNEAGIFMPPQALLDAKQKSLHVRAKKMIDVAALGIEPPFVNLWLLTRDKTEVVVDYNLNDFVVEMPADTDYTGTPWLTLGDPSTNPTRAVRWTKATYDPVPKAWLISVVKPLDVNGVWLGTLGKDLYLNRIFFELLQNKHRYPKELDFILDGDGNYLQAGPWQHDLEANPAWFKLDLSGEPQLKALFNSALTNQAQAFQKEVSVKGQQYLAIGTKISPLGWRYYRLVPMDGILASFRQLFFAIVASALLIGLLVGLLIRKAIQSLILERLNKLARKVEQRGPSSIQPRPQLLKDESTAKAHTTFGHPIELSDEIDEATKGVDIAIAQLEANERELRLIIDNVPGVVSRVDNDLRYVFASNGYAAVFGKTNDEVVGYTMQKVVGEKVFKQEKSYIKRVLAGENVDFEMEFINPAGEKRHALLHFIANKNAEGLQDGFFIIGIDITERKQAIMMIEDSRNLLTSIIDAVPVRIFWKDLNSRYLGGNKAFTQDAHLIGPLDLVGKFDKDLWWSKSADKFVLEDHAVIETGLSKLNYEHMIYRPDGDPEWVVTSKIPLKNLKDEIIGVLGVEEDITERKRSEDARVNAQSRLIKIASSLPGMVYQLQMNANGTVGIPYASDHLQTMFGLDPAEVRNDASKVFAMVHSDDIEDLMMAIYISERDLTRCSEEFRMLMPNGKLRWFYLNAIPEQQADGVVIWFAYMDDVTDRKHQEDAKVEVQNRLAKIASRLPGVVYQFRRNVDGSFCFPFASDTIKQIYRVRAEEVRDDAAKIFEILHPEDYGRIVESIEKSAKNLSAWKEEYRVRFTNPDGTTDTRWLQGDAIPEQQVDGAIVWHGFISDITERKQIESELVASQYRWKFAIEGAGDGVWDVNVQTQEANYSKRWKEMLGYEEGENFVSRKEWIKRIHPEDKARVLEQGEAYLSGKVDQYVIEYRLKCKDGQYKWMQSRGMLVSRDDAGKPLRMIGTQTDITERINAQLLLQQTKAELEISHDNFKDLYEFAPIGYLTINRHGLITQLNWRASAMLGLDRRSLINKRIAEFVDESDKFRWARMYQSLKELEAGEELSFDIKFNLANGTAFHGNLNCIKMDDVDEQSMLRITLEDISKIKKSEAELRVAAIALETNDGLMITDAENTILRVNHALTKITGYSDEEVVGKNPRMFKSDRHDADFFAAMWESINTTGQWTGEIWNKRKNGQEYPENLTITAVKTDKGIITNYVGTFTDISYIKAAADEIQQLAFFDSLTHLPNRRLLMDRLKHALASSARSGRQGAVLFLDLDHFKVLNDSRGHDVGDLLLKQVAERLTACVREGDTVSRLGGDEYVVVLEDLSEDGLEAAALTETIAKKILDALDKPYQLGEYEHHNTPSIGIAIFNSHHATIDELLKQADIAMYQAKKAGRNTIRFFNPQMQTSITFRVALERELRKAIDKEQLQLYYQVQVDNAGHQLGAEALIRWVHPERGLISPAQFIPLAEETGLILPIGNWVLNTACAQIKTWHKNPLARDLTLSINVSAKQFRQADFVTQVKAAIERHGIDPMQLKLELTESLLLESIDDTINSMTALGELGVQFSLDDFGTGYSSLQYLKKLPLYQLKIDQSFVRDIVTDSHDRSIVRTIIAMAQSLYLNVIAEGVETEEQKELLLSHGCKRYQGYLFGKPLPIKEFNAMLKDIDAI